MDLPSGWYDENTVNLPTSKGSDFEQLFGATIDDFQFSGTNRQLTIAGKEVQGFTINSTATAARVVEIYDNGKPAVLEHSLGKGKAILLGFQASLNAFENSTKPSLPILQYTLGAYSSSYSCPNALVYRLAAPEADHYFLLNEATAKTVALTFKNLTYKRVTDAITGKTVNSNQLKLATKGGLWIRAEK